MLKETREKDTWHGKLIRVLSCKKITAFCLELRLRCDALGLLYYVLLGSWFHQCGKADDASLPDRLC
jgi:hypothetical protein